jgi:hypothetical protein
MKPQTVALSGSTNHSEGKLASTKTVHINATRKAAGERL